MIEFLLPALMVLTLFGGILLGFPVGLVLGGVAAVFLLASDLPMAFFNMMVSRIYSNALTNWLFLAIPMFILMGMLLDRTGLARGAFKVTERLFHRVPGHLALTVIFIGGLLAAATGVVGASVVLLSVLALPRMLDSGSYTAPFAAGLVTASGTLAILMPPSVMLIILSGLVSVPVGTLFSAALVPSAMLLGLYALYSVLFLWWRQRRGRDATAPNARSDQGEIETEDGPRGFLQCLYALVPFVVLIPSVLGAIITGTASPTEASGLGVLGVLLFAGLSGRLRWSVLRLSGRETALSTAMIMLLVIAATCFSLVFKALGGDGMINALLGLVGQNDWGIILFILLLVFLLGFFLDWLEISLILMPLFAPVVMQLDLGNGLQGTALMAWFAILFAINLQSSFLTPPFGVSLFYLKGAVADRVSTGEIYRGVAPFILLQLLVVVIIMVFPQALWL